jgi:hypothetical protein
MDVDLKNDMPFFSDIALINRRPNDTIVMQFYVQLGAGVAKETL